MLFGFVKVCEPKNNHASASIFMQIYTGHWKVHHIIFLKYLPCFSIGQEWFVVSLLESAANSIFQDTWGVCPQPLQKTCTFGTWLHLHIRCQPGHLRPCFPHNIFQNLTGLHVVVCTHYCMWLNCWKSDFKFFMHIIPHKIQYLPTVVI